MEDINQYYERIESYIKDKMTYQEMAEKSNEIILSAPRQFQDRLYEHLANIILDSFVDGSLNYSSDIAKSFAFAEYSKIIAKLNTNEPLTDIYRAIEHLLSGKNELVLERINTWLEAKLAELSGENDIFNCTDFVYSLAVTLKNGFPGLWVSIGKLLDRKGVEKGLSKMCNALEKVYYSDNNDEILDALSLVLMENSDIYLAKELLGYTYYTMGMWPNGIAYFEQLETHKNAINIFFKDMIYFFMAWCYGKLRDYRNEELYYRKAYELYPEADYVLNNIGYSLYKQKKYQESKVVFKQCIELQRDTKYAINNLVRAHISLNEKKEAQDLIKKYSNISKDLKNRIKKLSTQSKTIEYIEEEESVVEKPSRIAVELGIKKHQFSSERILEDELTMRLEAGVNVFGIPLKIYKKHGMYGRQFIIPVGRMDILAVDEEENLYVIELKKDSGYNDAYKQTVKYIEWLSNNTVDKDKKVYGIICLNAPSKELIDKVRQDRRIKLFEYEISYREIK